MQTNPLLNCFFKECNKNFSFLNKKAKLDHLAGLSRYEQGRIIITAYNKKKNAGYPFFATSRYESDPCTIEISYGDYDLSVQCYLIYQRRYRVTLDSALMLFDEKTQKTTAEHVLTPKKIKNSLKNIKKQLKTHWKTLLSLNNQQIYDAIELQSAINQQIIRENNRKHRETACEKAKKAFEKGDFKAVIMFYRPYKDSLPPEDYRRLTLAITYLDEN